jgi:hypothetical protein
MIKTLSRSRLIFFLFAAPLCFSESPAKPDFGLILDQKALFSGGEQSADTVEYSGAAIPWLAAPLGEKADLYLSGGISAHYDGEEWEPLPEIYRFEFIYNPGPNLRFDIGRIPFKESLSLVCAGLFDGFSAGLNIGGGRVSAGLFYTGLLYKKAAFIYMSPEDRVNHGDKNSYFASRRLVAGINWEKTSVFDTQNSFALSGVCQFDLNGTAAPIHSQYLEAKFTAPLGLYFNTVSGAVVEFAQEKGINPYAAFALSAELQWFPPSALRDMFTLGGRFSSGAWNEALGVFIPVTAEAQGRVLRPMLSGIAFVEAAYTLRPRPSLAAGLSGAYFFRTDKTTCAAPGMDAGSASPLLGGEIYGGLSWAPLSDVLFSFGGGVFLPRLGKVFADNAEIIYRVELAASISL